MAQDIIADEADSFRILAITGAEPAGAITLIYEDGDRHLSAELSQKMGSATRLGDLTQDDILLFGVQLGLSCIITKRQLDKILKNIEIKADQIIEYVESLEGITGKAGELRILKEIRLKMISEMVARLSLPAA